MLDENQDDENLRRDGSDSLLPPKIFDQLPEELPFPDELPLVSREEQTEHLPLRVRIILNINPTRDGSMSLSVRNSFRKIN